MGAFGGNVLESPGGAVASQVLHFFSREEGSKRGAGSALKITALLLGIHGALNWAGSESKQEHHGMDNNCNRSDGEQKMITLKACPSVFGCLDNIGKGK